MTVSGFFRTFLEAVIIICFLLGPVLCGPVSAKTLVLEGRLDSRIAVTQQMGFSVDKPVSSLSFRFAMPAAFSNRTVSQELQGLDIRFDPEPSSVDQEVDTLGNHYRKVIWKGLKTNARVNISFQVRIKSELSAMESKSPFPVKSIPQNDMLYLKPTDLVQSSDPEIVSLSKRLSAGALTHYDAVTSILNYVSDNIKYTYNPPQFDALYTLGTKSGNCQNFAHLSIALLRAAGIPARIVGGISLKQTWRIPVGNNNFLVQSMGQGGHAWMEIYFPDLGWLSYDPQQSKQFTSSRHIKQTQGLDSNDINDSWRAAPYMPEYNENIDARFLDDAISLKPKSSSAVPRSYLLSNNFTARAEIPKPQVEVKALPPVEVRKLPTPVEVKPKPVPVPLPPVEVGKVPEPAEVKPKPELKLKPTPEVEKTKPELKPKPTPLVEKPKPPVEVKKAPEPIEVKPKPRRGSTVEFGNMEFPNLVDIFKVTGDRGMKILDKETAEYVTSKYVYAQAVTVEDKISVGSVSLAMRKFGGDGTVYIDLVSDDNGKPGLSGLRSVPVFLENIKRRPGYYWVDFAFPPGGGVSLQKGKYWLVLRHSGEAIMNWFYIPGKPYSGSDDTRSTLKGYKWEDILNYDFVFKVKGVVE